MPDFDGLPFIEGELESREGRASEDGLIRREWANEDGVVRVDTALMCAPMLRSIVTCARATDLKKRPANPEDRCMFMRKLMRVKAAYELTRRL
jgi:hypothetical protein